MKVTVHLYSQSQPIIISPVRNAYTKDGLYCVWKEGEETVYKFPFEHIFRITEQDWSREQGK